MEALAILIPTRGDDDQAHDDNEPAQKQEEKDPDGDSHIKTPPPSHIEGRV